MSSTTMITRDAAISVAKRRVKLMREADTLLRAGKATEAQARDLIARECELFLHAHGFGQFV